MNLTWLWRLWHIAVHTSTRDHVCRSTPLPQPRPEAPYVTGLPPVLMTDLERRLSAEIERLMALLRRLWSQRKDMEVASIEFPRVSRDDLLAVRDVLKEAGHRD